MCPFYGNSLPSVIARDLQPARLFRQRCINAHIANSCRFKHEHAPQCPYEVQQDLQTRLTKAASEGHDWAREILLVRPCQIFPFLEGRTMWIIGDSMSKVALPLPGKLACITLHIIRESCAFSLIV